ncbi:ADP-ribosylglycohydrolase family protein [Stackebrandtia soli]|uniref:ADP-ribosylglycohydrolase family protein n=1 Tax=Stackebrandtia soli TaxID=1892856 RepID=UPI0039E8CB69
MPSTNITPPSLDRVRGCVLGGAIGDALGNPIEFDPTDVIRAEYGSAGLTGLTGLTPDGFAVITDDTQMTLFTIDGLLRGGTTNEASPSAVMSEMYWAYQRWFRTQNQREAQDPPDGWLAGEAWLYHRRAPGLACLSGLRSEPPAPNAPLHGAGPVNPESKGYGTVMRSAPFGLAWGPENAFEHAARCARLTHGHPTGYLAAGAFAAIVSLVARDTGFTAAIEETLTIVARYPDHRETTDAIVRAVNAAATAAPTPERVERVGGGWIAEEALAVGLYCALAAESDTGAKPEVIARALLASVNHSGDSDSTGSICGNLLGARHGRDALPIQWLTHVEHTDAIDAAAIDLASALGTPDAPPRDADYWRSRYPTTGAK